MQFHGAYTALVTPFKNGEVDESAYRLFIEWQIEQGINGLVPCGTTGESATLTHAEHGEVIRICVDQAAGRVPVLAGAGSNNTKEAVELARYAEAAGADGVLLITPYYNKPTPKGMLEHFKAVAKKIALPIVVYNVPGRTAINIPAKQLQSIKEHIPSVVGVKDATACLQQVSDIVEYCGADFCTMSGDDFTVLPLLSVGGCGVISVVSNIMPGPMAKMITSFKKGDIDTARKLHFQMQAVVRALFSETNPIPVKTALALMGKMDLELRLPLTPMEPENEAGLKKILKEQGLI